MDYIAESLVISEDNKLVALIHPDYEMMKRDNITEEQLNKIFRMHGRMLMKGFPIIWLCISSESTLKSSLKLRREASGDSCTRNRIISSSFTPHEVQAETAIQWIIIIIVAGGSGKRMGADIRSSS